MAIGSQGRRDRSARAIAELIEQLSRTIASRAFIGGMNPVHWTALRYLSQANESARQVGAFAKFHMTTPSSASQTMTALENKGLVIKKAGPDGRQRILELTPKGRRLLNKDPIQALAASIQTLSDEQMLLMAEVMENLTRTSLRVSEDAGETETD
jgi:DNA-binding MarR family transcriptional regulator